MKDIKTKKRKRRHIKIRKKVHGTKKNPRLAVFKSNKHIYAQLIDDEKGVTLASVSDLSLSKGKKAKNTNITDQMHLQQVLRGEYIESHNVTLFCLPSSYYCIYDIMKDWTEPVIKQYQASRRHRASRRHLR